MDNELEKDIDEIMTNATRDMALEQLDQLLPKIRELVDTTELGTVHFGYIIRKDLEEPDYRKAHTFQGVSSAIDNFDSPMAQVLSSNLMGERDSSYLYHISNKGIAILALMENDYLTVRVKKGETVEILHLHYSECAEENIKLDLSLKQLKLLNAFVGFRLSPIKLKETYPDSYKELFRIVVEIMKRLDEEGEDNA